MWETAAAIIAGIALLWSIWTHVQLRRERHAHESTLELVRRRNEVVTQLSGFLREARHCTDDHAGESSYESRLDDTLKSARKLALQNDRLIGEEVIKAVQRETTLAEQLFKESLQSRVGPRRELDAARNARAMLLDRLGKQYDFPPKPGAVSGEQG